MSEKIPQSEINSLLEKIKTAMLDKGIQKDIIKKTTLIVIHPDDWEVSLLVPSEGVKISQIRKFIESILFKTCKVEERCCDYLGKSSDYKAFEWYFRHPNTPQDIYERLEQELEEELGSEIGMGLPVPAGFKSKSDTVFVTLKDVFYDAIDKGKKNVEYRLLNQYYCDKFFSPGIKKRFIKFNRGYQSGNENQMVFEIAQIMLVNEYGDAIPAHDEKGALIISYAQLPPNFAPCAYAIRLGRRVR